MLEKLKFHDMTLLGIRKLMTLWPPFSLSTECSSVCFANDIFYSLVPTAVHSDVLYRARVPYQSTLQKGKRKKKEKKRKKNPKRHKSANEETFTEEILYFSSNG